MTYKDFVWFSKSFEYGTYAQTQRTIDIMYSLLMPTANYLYPHQALIPWPMFLHTESHRQKSERVLVFSELGISGAAAAVVAYLIRKNHWTLKVL